MNITLIGMAGAGKSYVGKLLAEKLNMQLLNIDTDVLESRYGKPLQGVLDQLGDEQFIAMEENAIIESTAGKDNLVISPGGSIAYEPMALEHLRNISTIIYLEVPFEVVAERVGSQPPRGIVGLGKKTLRELYDERTLLYQNAAHITIAVGEKSTEQIIGEIIDIIDLK